MPRPCAGKLHGHPHALDPVELLEDLLAQLFLASPTVRECTEGRIAGVEILVAPAIHHGDRLGGEPGTSPVRFVVIDWTVPERELAIPLGLQPDERRGLGAPAAAPAVGWGG